MKFLALLLAAFSAAFCAVLAQDLSKLSGCALTCVVDQVMKHKCTSPFDKKCICTEGFTNDATACLIAKCPPEDIPPALNLEREICPDLGLPNLDPLSPCAQKCVIKTLTGAACKGPLDKNCICGLNFGLRAVTCLIGQCRLTDVGPSLGLQIGICKGSGGLQTCTATGLWRLLQPVCLLKPRSLREDMATAISTRRRDDASLGA